jgi:putative Ca2+/H+ antiporter (TMEM165/GDT1 family)
MIFVAELGDKTQLATLSLAASAGQRWPVFLGASLALVATSGIAVLLGGALSNWFPEQWIRKAAGVVFLAMGLFYLLGKG